LAGHLRHVNPSFAFFSDPGAGQISSIKLQEAGSRCGRRGRLEIKRAVDQLSPAELAELVAYVRELDSAAWDEQIDRDAANGKLDFLFEEADAARATGTMRDWPEA